MGVAGPGVDGEAASVEFERVDGLAKRAVGIALGGTEFDEEARAGELDKGERERDVLYPGGDIREQTRALRDDGEIQRIEGHNLVSG